MTTDRSVCVYCFEPFQPGVTVWKRNGGGAQPDCARKYEQGGLD
jgi:hypothetical protein